MVVPDWDPGKLFVAGEQVQVGPVGCQALSVVVERVDLSVGQRNASDAVSPAAGNR